jgi:hypothetical protein
MIQEVELLIRWHCMACDVWGQDMEPAICWACGTESVKRKFGPPLGDADRSGPTSGSFSEARHQGG